MTGVYLFLSALGAASGNRIQPHHDRIADAQSPLKIRVEAVRDLGWAGTEDGEHHDALIGLFKHREPATRAAAVGMLRTTGCRKKSAIPAPIDRLGDEELAAASVSQDQSPEVVANALVGFGAAAAVPGLAEVLKDGEIGVPELAAMRLAGQFISPALPLVDMPHPR